MLLRLFLWLLTVVSYSKLVFAGFCWMLVSFFPYKTTLGSPYPVMILKLSPDPHLPQPPVNSQFSLKDLTHSQNWKYQLISVHLLGGNLRENFPSLAPDISATAFYTTQCFFFISLLLPPTRLQVIKLMVSTWAKRILWLDGILKKDKLRPWSSLSPKFKLSHANREWKGVTLIVTLGQ